jgi:hypothetical protein
VIAEEVVIAVLLVLMLQQVAQVAECRGAVRTMIREIGNIVRAASMRQHGNIVRVVLYLRLTGSKLVDLVPGVVVNSYTPGTVATFDILHTVGGWLESLLSAYGTAHIARTVELHVHFKIVRVVKGLGAYRTREERQLDAFDASRSTSAIIPLVVAKLIRRSTIATLSATTFYSLADAVDAPRISFTFLPLVMAKVVTPLLAISTPTTHVADSLLELLVSAERSER